MDFTQAIRSVVVERYADFSGRASRSEYWWFLLFYLILSLVIGIVGSASDTLGTILRIVVGLGLLVPSIAVAVRRLHDIDRTGWWYLIVLTGIGAIVLLVFFVLRGTPGDNRFGSDPLGNVAARFA